MDRRTRYPAEVKERAVRMVFDHGSEYDSESTIMSRHMTVDLRAAWSELAHLT